MDYLPPRVFNGEGREGDMLNLVFVGQQEDLQKAFERAGWVKTDKWKPIFVWHLLWHGTNDARLPMSRLLSVRKSAGLLVCLAGAGCGRLAASPYSNLENRLHDGWDARLGGFGHP